MEIEKSLAKIEASIVEKLSKSIERVRTDLDLKIESVKTDLTLKIGDSIQQSEARIIQKLDDSFDELARMTQIEFVAVDKRFDAVEERFDGRFDGVDRKLIGLQNQLDNIYINYVTRQEHGLLSGRVSKIERKLNIAHQ